MKVVGVPLPESGCPSWSLECLDGNWGESEATYGDNMRDHCDIGIGSAEYPHGNEARTAYIERDPVDGMYPDDYTVLFFDNGNSWKGEGISPFIVSTRRLARYLCAPAPLEACRIRLIIPVRYPPMVPPERLARS